MVKFLKIQFELGRITEDKLDELIARDRITLADKRFIMGVEEPIGS